MTYKIEKGEYRGRVKGWWITKDDHLLKFFVTREKARAAIKRYTRDGHQFWLTPPNVEMRQR